MPGTFAARTLATVFLMRDHLDTAGADPNEKNRPLQGGFPQPQGFGSACLSQPQQMLMPLSYEIFLPADHGWMVTAIPTL